MAAAFHFFSSLSAELRIQIWQNALPKKVEQALYFYKKGCWCPRRLTEADEDYDPENDELNLNFEFRHNSLGYVQFEAPLFSVNREARSITLSWFHQQGVRIHFQKDRQCPIFLRRFDPPHDTIYIPLNQWNDFLCEPLDRLFEPDLIQRNVGCPAPAFTRIAIPEALLQDEADLFSDIFHWYSSLQKLFIVISTPPDLLPEDNGIAVQGRWEMENMRGATFFWHNDRSSFELSDGEYIDDKTLYKLLKKAGDGLHEQLIENEKLGFEIQAVFAVRR
ncbi:hypothetical protein HIM_01333 [Hirsutella minnesotensis 3608]|nr:hypothetical protein HIM_01333 [Hirsutella minnesotensis 3608]